MKPTTSFLLLSVITAIVVASCVIFNARPLETMPTDITWERRFHKDDLERIEKMAFSPNGDRFIVSDGFDFITLWKKPFQAPARKVPIEEYEDLAALRFFGHQQDIFFTFSGGFTQIWDKDLQTRKFSYKFPSNHTSGISAVTSNGRFIAWHGDLYDRKKKSLVGRSMGHAMGTGISFGDKSLLLTSGYWDQRITVRNIFNGKFEDRLVPYPVNDGAVSPNEKYALAVTRKGRCYLWNWPDKEPEVLRVSRKAEFMGGFSPDSKWFAIWGDEFLYIFQTDPLKRLICLKHDPGITSVRVASNNLIVIGDRTGRVHIFDVAAQKVIAQKKVLRHGVSPVELFVGKGFLWVATNDDYLEPGEKGEIALYHIKGLDPYVEPHKTDSIKYGD
jgi:WD40 repeat protein